MSEKGLSSGLSEGNFEDYFEDYTWKMDVKSTLQESVHALNLLVYHPDKTRQFSVVTYVENI